MKLTLRDADGFEWKKLEEPAVVYDMNTQDMLHVGEYSDMVVILEAKKKELCGKGQSIIAKNLYVDRIESQELLDVVWQSGKMRILN